MTGAAVSRRLLSAVAFPELNAWDTRIKLQGSLDPFCHAKRAIVLPMPADDLDAERKTVLAKPGRKRRARRVRSVACHPLSDASRREIAELCQLSSPAKAKAVIQYSRDAGDGIERQQRTGYPACVGYEDSLWGRLFIAHNSRRARIRGHHSSHPPQCPAGADSAPFS